HICTYELHHGSLSYTHIFCNFYPLFSLGLLTKTESPILLVGPSFLISSFY
ncbi:unnamed protein product, partial [Brassica rapa subsp. trilocularis]